MRAQIQQGFTLIELMIVIVVLGVLLTIAVPSFNDSLLGSKLSSNANNFVASVYLARGEAIKRNAAINLCVSSDGANCTGGNWAQGWIVRAGDGTIIQRQAALPSGLIMTESAGISSISFQPSGVGATSATLTLCRATPNVGGQERVITVTASGRPSVAKTTTGACS